LVHVGASVIKIDCRHKQSVRYGDKQARQTHRDRGEKQREREKRVGERLTRWAEIAGCRHEDDLLRIRPNRWLGLRPLRLRLRVGPLRVAQW
jgi:hypothetical protein